MPWKESRPLTERMDFISRLLDGDSMTRLCEEFGISRTTGYKFRDRFLSHGPAGLLDYSRRPSAHPRQTSSEIERLVIDLRELKPTWGPKKLKARLEALHPGVKVPAASTIGTILDRNGIEQRRRKARRKAFRPTGLTSSKAPNDIWCVDFKGQFRLKSGKYCYPLTVTDHYSRYLLCCEALSDTKVGGVLAAFELLFEEHGLPKVILSDNGSPFASRSVQGLSRLSAWWLKNGIKIERIEPGHPEQNGRHERFHRTLKQETVRPPAKTLLQQQERFDYFKDEYNKKRPHEALEMRTPDLIWSASERKYNPNKKLTYPLHEMTRTVNQSGCIRGPGGPHIFIGRALSGETLGLRQLDEKQWLATYAEIDLGYIDMKARKFTEKPILRA